MLLPQSPKRRLQRLTLQPHQLITPLQIASSIALTSEQRHYLGNVLRLGNGDQFIALDRQGGWWLAELSANLDLAVVSDRLENHAEFSAQVHLGIAMPKGNNLESVIRQATELGVRQILPLFSDRTVIKAGADIGNQKRDRWQRIAEETSELSLRTYIPAIAMPQSFATWLAQINAAQLSTDQSNSQIYKYLCVTKPDAPHLLSALGAIAEAKASQDDQKLEIAIATGCEGGWTDREEEMAIAAGFIPVSLGDRVLSAVTAPVVALSIVGAFLDTK